MSGHARDATPAPSGEETPGGRIEQGLADVLVHRLFAVGLDLHAALTYIEAHLAEGLAIGKIHKAINGLDGAIRDFRGVVFDLHPEGRGAPDGLRALIVEAVERACAPGDACPSITLGHSMETVIDEPAWQGAAQVVHRILTLVPCERLPDAHITVTADPRPPTRLVMHIDAPAGALTEVAGRIRSLAGDGAGEHEVDVFCQSLPRSPERSRIRLEWPVAPR